MSANYSKQLYKDYEKLLIKSEELLVENKTLKKENRELKREICGLKKRNKELEDSIDDKVNKAFEKAMNLFNEDRKVYEEKIVKLENEVNRLKNQINKDSSNSSKPPSSNGFKKVVQNSRQKSGKKPGGQKGHKGKTLSVYKNPDKILEHQITSCSCGGKIENETYVPKQIVDIEIITTIAEHRFFNGICSICGKKHKYPIPESLKNPVNYGNRLKVITTYLNNEGVVSINRSSEFIKLITNGKINISESTVCNWNKQLSSKLEPVVNEIKQKLLNSKILHVDETPIKINGNSCYVHNVSNEKYTYQMAHKKRGMEAVKDIGLLPLYVGTLVSDHFLMYYNYGSDNAECNVHISRYLKGVYELTNHEWAKEFLKYLYDIKSEKEQKIKNNEVSFSSDEISLFLSEYDRLIKYGFAQYNKDGTDYPVEEGRLLRRLEKYKANHLLFATNFQVPFDNNLAERDVRAVKTKQKIGKFRSVIGAKSYSIIRSIISTYKKHGINVLDAFNNALDDSPIIV